MRERREKEGSREGWRTKGVREERGEREESIWELRGDSGEKSSAGRERGTG